ncbi:MAG: nuclear transport factor 2 family protein [Halieaceae bacterium]|nr:nuclear transport factor 2 family protein [Halieaceae bacterium]
MSTQNELAIRDLNARYIDAVNRYNADDWIATWSPTATWDLMGHVVEGSEAILQTWQGAMSGFEMVVMMLSSGTIQVESEKATGRWYLTEHLNPKDGDANMTLGVYNDEYALEDGRWVFTRRSYNVIYQGPQNLSGNYIPYRP